MKKIILLLSFLMFCKPANAVNCEVRGTWLNAAAVTPSRLNTTINNIKNAHLNTVFILGPYSGGTPTSDFVSAVKMATGSGLSVHMWMPVGTANFELAQGAGSREEIRNIVLNYFKAHSGGLDGLHLDYIRYGSSTDNVLSKTKLEGVSKFVEEMYTALKTAYPNKFLTAAVKTSLRNKLLGGIENRPIWFNSWIVNNNVAPNITYDLTAGIPDFIQFHQDPIAWIRSGYIDGIMPMMYYSKDEYESVWKQQLLTYKSFLTMDTDYSAKIFNGLGWYIDSGSNTYYEYNIPGLVERINYTRSLGLFGNVIFEFSHKDPGGTIHNDDTLVSTLVSGPYKEIVPSCLSLVQKNKTDITYFHQLLSQFTSLFYYNNLVGGYGQ